MGLNQLGLLGNFGLVFDSVMATSNICCSIEMEPKTLSQGQLNYARELAADVVQNAQPKEATVIFIKGLEPVEEIEKNEQILQKVEPLNVANDQKAQVIIERPCQCSLTKIVESPDQINLKEPLSAPF